MILLVRHDTQFKPTPATKNCLVVTDSEFAALCKKYGVHTVDWYFTSPGRIKFFKDNHWQYTSL